MVWGWWINWFRRKLPGKGGADLYIDNACNVVEKIYSTLFARIH